jgi:hypothetical protein
MHMRMLHTARCIQSALTTSNMGPSGNIPYRGVDVGVGVGVGVPVAELGAGPLLDQLAVIRGHGGRIDMTCIPLRELCSSPLD